MRPKTEKERKLIKITGLVLCLALACVARRCTAVPAGCRRADLAQVPDDSMLVQPAAAVKHMSIPRIMQIIDASIVIAGAFVFGPTKALYAIVAIVVVAKITDGLMEGLHYAKAVYIITDKHEEVSRILLSDLNRGVTGVHARGMYGGNDKMMLFCVVDKKQIVQLKEIVASVDPTAFVIVTDVREVLGEGFNDEHIK